MKARNIALSVVASVATLASASALAFDFDGFYVLGGVGVAGVNDMKFASGDDVESDTTTTFPLTEARSDFAWRGGLGMWLTDNIGIEANYMGMSSHSDEVELDGHHHRVENSDLNFWDLTGIGRCFIGDDFWVFGRAGLAYADRTYDLTSTTSAGVVTFSESDDNGGMGASFGVGAQYDIMDWVGVRLEASTIQALNDNDMYAFTGNLVLNIPELM